MHHRPNFKCGYDQNVVCKGIQLLLPFAQPGCSNSNDFFRLPTKFQSVIQSVQFFDFGSNAFSDADLCITQYDPLGQGLFDAYGKLNGKGTPANRCYKQDPQQRPGILLPLPQLSAFSPAMLQAVPTVAVVGTLSRSQITKIGAGMSVTSGCYGFQIRASYKHRKVTITVDQGSFLATTDQQGTPNEVQIKKQGPWEVPRQNAEYIQIWLIIQENIKTHQWTGKVAYTLDGGDTWQVPNVPTKHIKRKLLGTVSYFENKVDVVQSQCSPVDMRDGTDVQIKGSTDKLVFIYDTQSGTKKWVALSQCG